ncbi:MAG: hypothetical protein LAO03_14070 [Acidobacteriia bacterium]|nr:hypothetical protein [Terriglobia bacterium]
MKHFWSTVLLLGLWTGLAAAQNLVLVASGPSDASAPSFLLPADDSSVPVSAMVPASNQPAPALAALVTLPRMAPELALRAYERRCALQEAELVSYSATTVIRAQLPDSSQYGEYQLQRHFSAPRTLEFKAVHFEGDNFVKSNIITRLLQSEVDHVQKDDTSLTALTAANYKFSFKGTGPMEGHLVHVYQVKPRKNRVGLFKGRIYLDAYTGSLVRVEGAAVKSPSFFVKKLEFLQDYADIGSFTFPVHTHSEAKARIVGRTVVDIYQRDYQPVANTVQTAQQIPSL